MVELIPGNGSKGKGMERFDFFPCQSIRETTQGSQSYLLEGESGDPDRLFIGGIDSLYRFKHYEGQWNNDEKEGQGKATYVNGDSIEGEFHRGQPHGILLYRFANGKEKYATFVRGQRVEWTSDVEIKMKKALVWLDDAASFRREFRNEPDT
jgi:hypothetical protein